MRRTGWSLACLVAVMLAWTERTGAFEPWLAHIGLGECLHPIQEPGCLCYPGCCRDKACCCCADHIYIFAVNGLDPLCKGNLNGLCAYLEDQGFKNTYFGQLHSSHAYCSEIRAIRRQDPCARIVLIGFSLGCNHVRCMANWLGREGIQIDLLVYLAGDTIWNTARSCPCNVCRVLNVTAHGLVITGRNLIFNGSDLDCACNHRLRTRHMQVPSRRETVELLMAELLAMACMPCDGNGAEALPAPDSRQLPATEIDPSPSRQED